MNPFHATVTADLTSSRIDSFRRRPSLRNGRRFGRPSGARRTVND